MADKEDVVEMRSKLMSFGIDTSLDKSPTLTIGEDTKENYNQLFRVLKRLSANEKISYTVAKELMQTYGKWKNNEPYKEEDFKRVNPKDANRILDILEFKKRKIAPNRAVFNGSTLLVIYDGPAYRQRKIYVGELSGSISLPSGQKMKKLILISKEVAVFLNWLEAHFPFGKRKCNWDSAYSLGTDKTHFGVMYYFITTKLDSVNAQRHKRPLDEIFNQFYLDYAVSYSSVMQRRMDEKLRTESVATAYLTKKNIPEDVRVHMESTKLLKLFNYVEFDEGVDFDEIKTFEKDVLFFKNDILFKHSVSSLRIRRLGKHSSQYKTTSGLYYPSLDNISIDLKGLSSFVHEWGHAVDSHLGNPSAKDETFIEEIHLQVVKYLHRNKNLDTRQIQYYSMPGEVFARAFEWYINDKYKPEDNTALKTDKEYQTEEQYAVFNNIKDVVKDYFFDLEKMMGVEII